MDCRQFRQNWEPSAGAPANGCQQAHVQRCDACRDWQAEQAAADQWLRAALRAAVEAPVAPPVGARLIPCVPPPRPQRQIAWQDLRGRIGYAAAAALTAAALLATALRPEF